MDWGVAGGWGVAIGAAAPGGGARGAEKWAAEYFQRKISFPSLNNKVRVLGAHKGKSSKCGFLYFLSFPDGAFSQIYCHINIYVHLVGIFEEWFSKVHYFCQERQKAICPTGSGLFLPGAPESHLHHWLWFIHNSTDTQRIQQQHHGI